MKTQVLGIATQILVMAIVISVVLIFVGIGVLVLIHVCFVGRAFRLGFGNNINNNNNNMVVERRSLGSTSMSRDDLEKLPCFDFQAKEDKGCGNSPSPSPVDCAVCLENFKAGEKCRLLPLCRHSFHAECVDMWLLKTPICPICRASAGFLRAAGAISAEESSRYGDTGNTFRNYRQMENESESGHLSEAAVVSVGSQSTESDRLTDETGDELGDGQRIIGTTTTGSENVNRENQIPANISHVVNETVLTELRQRQLAAEMEVRLRQTA